MNVVKLMLSSTYGKFGSSASDPPRSSPSDSDLLSANEQLDELVGAPRSDSAWAQRWSITEAGVRALEAARREKKP